MRIAYFDCSSGISGDMLLGAFIDTGLSASYLEKELKKLKINRWELKVKNVERKNLPAKQVIIDGEKFFSSPEEMVKVIKKSKLNKRIKGKALDIFSSLTAAERKVHRISKSSALHLHELAHLDTLIDIVGSCIAVDNFQIDKIYASAINIGSAAPVTLELLRGLPVYTQGAGEELTTPTGAAIITAIAEDFFPLPLMKVENYGFGAGSKDLSYQANLLRLMIGETSFSFPNPKNSSPVPKTGSSNPDGFFGTGQGSEEYEYDRVILLETNIDDMNPQIYPYLTERLFEKGALDVWLTPVQMKKGRPGIVLSCLVNLEKKEEIIDLIFRETTTLGIRLLSWERVKLRREIKKNSSGLTYKIAYGKNFQKEKVEYNQAVKFLRRSTIPFKVSSTLRSQTEGNFQGEPLKEILK